jgi:type I restriction enzyme S subunit
MTSQPSGWSVVKLGEIADVQLGKMLDRAKNVGEPYRYIGNINVRWFAFNISDLQEMQMTPEETNFYSIKNGDILVCEGGEPGRCAVWNLGDKKIAYQKALHRVRLGKTLVPNLFVWQMRLDSLSTRIANYCTGSTIKHLPRASLLNYPVLVPPLLEQKRIANKLDSVLARVDACRDRLDRLPALLKRFRQSILAAATSGQLTEDWREANLAKRTWNATKLESLCEAVFDGPFGSNLKSDDYTSSGVRVVRLENIGHLNFEASKETYISDEKYQGLVKHSLQPDDILFSSFVDEEVRVCLYPAKLPTAAINKADCFCLRPDASKCIPTYLSYRLASRATYVELKELVHGATRTRINLKQLRQYLVEIPELEEQTEIVRRVEILFAFADRLEARLTTARQQVGQLTPALLAKAFRGQLVPQDPADEPAAELLKRLAAQRAAAPKAKRGRSAA